MQRGRAIWTTCPAPDPEARCRLFCLPYAGAGASIFRGWPAALRGVAELWPVHLPGRERRLSDRAPDTVVALAGEVARGLAACLDRPFVLFGHSMGGLLSFEVARQLRRLDLPLPRALLVSGYGGPHLPDTRPRIHALPDAAFLEAIGALDGTPEDVLANTELMALLLSLLRADFRMVETYRFQPGVPLDMPIHVYGGRDDKDAPRKALEAWSAQTTGPATVTLFEGGHFYLKDEAAALLSRLRRDILALAAAPEPAGSRLRG